MCQPFYIEIAKYLQNKYRKVLKINDYYKKNFKNDDWFQYYKEVKDFGLSDYDKKFSKKDFNLKSIKFTHRFDAFFML